MTCRKKKVNY